MFPLALATAAGRALAAGATLAPNPTAGAATLAVPGWVGAAPVPVAVANALGQVVATALAHPQAGTLRAELPLGSLPPGIYTVRLLSPAGVVVKRLVRE